MVSTDLIYFDNTAAELPDRGRSSLISRSLSPPALRLPLPPPLGRPMRLFDRDALDALGGRRLRTVTFESPGSGFSMDELGRDGGGGMPVLAPRDDRLLTARGPVERFNPPFVGAYKPEEGMGSNVGVDGREVGVGMDEVVAVVALRLDVVVLMLPPERRDCGRFIPVLIELWPRPLGFVGRVGDPRVDRPGR